MNKGSNNSYIKLYGIFVIGKEEETERLCFYRFVREKTQICKKVKTLKRTKDRSNQHVNRKMMQKKRKEDDEEGRYRRRLLERKKGFFLQKLREIIQVK